MRRNGSTLRLRVFLGRTAHACTRAFASQLFYLWAADVDAREVTRTDVHELFELIPSARAPAKQLGPPDASSFV